MAHHWTELHEEKIGNYDIRLSYTWEDISPADFFDDSIDDIEEINRKIDSGLLYWAVARVQVFKKGIELSADYIGGLLYEDIGEIITDGIYEDLRCEAIHHADEVMHALLTN